VHAAVDRQSTTHQRVAEGGGWRIGIPLGKPQVQRHTDAILFEDILRSRHGGVASPEPELQDKSGVPPRVGCQ
jgi:hypothetical protein